MAVDMKMDESSHTIDGSGAAYHHQANTVNYRRMSQTTHDLVKAAVQIVAHVRASALAARAKRKQALFQVLGDAEAIRIAQVRDRALKRFASV